jgi:hypothetical protein
MLQLVLCGLNNAVCCVLCSCRGQKKKWPAHLANRLLGLGSLGASEE